MKVAKCMFISLLVILMVPGVAEALVEVTTHTTLQASKTKVHRGKLVTFSGELSAYHPACYKHQTLKIYRHGRKLGTVSSGETGSFSFSRRIWWKATYTVVFKGKIVGMHPYQKICKASGAEVTVKICRRHDDDDDRALPVDRRASRTGCR